VPDELNMDLESFDEAMRMFIYSQTRNVGGPEYVSFTIVLGSYLPVIQITGTD
jgi:hypothetical protein